MESLCTKKQKVFLDFLRKFTTRRYGRSNMSSRPNVFRSHTCWMTRKEVSLVKDGTTPPRQRMGTRTPTSRLSSVAEEDLPGVFGFRLRTVRAPLPALLPYNCFYPGPSTERRGVILDFRLLGSRGPGRVEGFGLGRHPGTVEGTGTRRDLLARRPWFPIGVGRWREEGRDQAIGQRYPCTDFYFTREFRVGVRILSFV